MSKGADATQSRGGIFLPLRVEFSSHCQVDALEFFSRLSHRQGNAHAQGSWKSREKAMRPAWLVKIPPLACGQSALFDKGVNTAGPATLADVSSPEIGEEPLTRGQTWPLPGNGVIIKSQKIQ